MSLNLRFKPILYPRISERLIEDACARIRSRTERNSNGVASKRRDNREEALKDVLKKWDRTNSFDIVTNVIGREKILLNIYHKNLQRSDSNWLPELEDNIAVSILGDKSKNLSRFRRKQTALLYFRHYSKIPAVNFFSNKLLTSFSSEDDCRSHEEKTWYLYRAILFGGNAIAKVTNSSPNEESFTQLLERLALQNLQESSDFISLLKESILLKRISEVSYGEGDDILEEIEKVRDTPFRDGLLMGSAALKILITRVANEGKSLWSPDWSKWIIRLGCDPRFSRSNEKFAKWWGWASNSEIRIAQQGVTGLTLSFFLTYLDHSLDNKTQFQARKNFLLKNLYESGKIISARLALNWNAYSRLDTKYKDKWSVTHLSQTTDDTSMIVLKCTDDIYIIEGTHNFALRVFYKDFPIYGFWDNPKDTYQDKSLRISPSNCSKFIPHDQYGHWVNHFYRYLRSLRIEWSI
jgi:hypothetical protein